MGELVISYLFSITIQCDIIINESELMEKSCMECDVKIFSKKNNAVLGV